MDFTGISITIWVSFINTIIPHAKTRDFQDNFQRNSNIFLAYPKNEE